MTTVRQMLLDRQFQLESPFPDQPDEYYREHDIVFQASNGSRKIVVYAHKESKFGINDARSLDHPGILIIPDSAKLSPESKMLLKQKNIQAFVESELLYNVTRHSLVPLHTKLTKTEENKLWKTLHCKKHNLAVISSQDPVVRYYGWQIGDVIRIVQRFGGTQEPSVEFYVIRELREPKKNKKLF